MLLETIQYDTWNDTVRYLKRYSTIPETIQQHIIFVETAYRVNPVSDTAWKNYFYTFHVLNTFKTPGFFFAKASLN